jgi:hypothetical protein
MSQHAELLPHFISYAESIGFAKCENQGQPTYSWVDPHTSLDNKKREYFIGLSESNTLMGWKEVSGENDFKLFEFLQAIIKSTDEIQFFIERCHTFHYSVLPNSTT